MFTMRCSKRWCHFGWILFLRMRGHKRFIEAPPASANKTVPFVQFNGVLLLAAANPQTVDATHAPAENGDSWRDELPSFVLTSHFKTQIGDDSWQGTVSADVSGSGTVMMLAFTATLRAAEDDADGKVVSNRQDSKLQVGNDHVTVVLDEEHGDWDATGRAALTRPFGGSGSRSRWMATG